MTQILFERFIKVRDSRRNDDSDCYLCSHGESFEYSETPSYSELYRNLPNFRDGKLWHRADRPKTKSLPCQRCFESWLDDRKDEGQICIRCGKWIVGGKTKAAMYIEARSEWEGGFTFTTYHSVCEECLLQGKSVDEWAKSIVTKIKEGGEKH